MESRDRLGGRIHTDYSFGFPVDLGASWYDLGVICIVIAVLSFLCLDLELHLTSYLQVARRV